MPPSPRWFTPTGHRFRSAQASISVRLAAVLMALALAACGNVHAGNDQPSSSRNGPNDDGGSSMLQALDLDGPMPLVRTDFTDDAAWRRVVAAVTAEVDSPDFGGAYTPNIQPIEDPAFDGATGETMAAEADGETYGYVILADARSMRESAGGELTVGLVDLSVAPEDAEEFGWVLGREFRSVVTEVASIEANLSIANMDFEEFADAVEGDGVFRGF